jgi:tetratricopeptide (TPR) repeat protein
MRDRNLNTERIDRMMRRGSAKGFGIFFLVALLLSGCAGPGGLTEPILDTPEHHVYSGFRLLRKARLDDARREFEQALALRPEYSPAYRGMGLVCGRTGNLQKGFQFMEKARERGETKEQVALAHVGLMRLHTMERNEGWFDAVERNFAQANALVTDLADAHYAMGLAYCRAYRLGEARASFNQVLAINESLTREAREQLDLIKTIESANPTTPIGKKLVFVNAITKAETARLLIHELAVERIYTDNALKRTAHAPKSRHTKEDIPVPADVASHALREDMLRILALDIPGLQSFEDGTFGPDEEMTRASFAMVMADIVMTLERNPALRTRYADFPSPFEDVEKHALHFNAVMVCKKHGAIMAGEGRFFHPMGTVSGAKALLAIRKLKEEYKL